MVKVMFGMVIAVLLTLFVISAFQMVEYDNQLLETRAKALSDYTQINPLDKALADKFSKKCFVDLYPNYTEKDHYLKTYECGLSINAKNLAELISKSDNSMRGVGFPLSMILKFNSTVN